MKFGVLLAFIAIFCALATALFFMLKSRDSGKTRAQKMAFALGMRVGLSILLFSCILLAWKLGYIRPTGIHAGQ